MHRSLLLALSLLTLAPRLEAQSSGRDFSWEGKLAPGATLYVRNLNGEMRVERASGPNAEVTAVKRWRRGDPDEVKIDVQKLGSGDVIICARWTANTECDERGYRTHNEGWRQRENDTSVGFTIRLPDRVNIVVTTVNGSVQVSGATAHVDAHTVNGRVEASTSGGPVRASSVNGNLDIRMRDLGSGDLNYSTVNGSIIVEVPSNLDADLEMSTVNGSLSADFPLTLNGRINPRHIRATIGRGGRLISFHTVNGSVEVRRAPSGER